MTAPDPDAVVELRGKLAGVALGPAMRALRDDRQRAFCFAYGAGLASTYAEAARMAGYAEKNARQLAHQLLLRGGERITKAIQEVARERFERMVPRVIAAAEKVIDDPKHKHHVPMLISLLGRMGYGEKSSVDVTVSGEVQLSHTEAALRDLAQMLEMRMPRETLINAFGEAGLARYSAMLGKQQPKLIEAAPVAGSVSPAPNLMAADNSAKSAENSAPETGE